VKILDKWKQEIMAKQKKTYDLLENTGRKLDDSRKMKRDVDEAAKLLNQVRNTYEFVVSANGVHNPDLAMAILNQVQKDAQKVEALLAAPAVKKEK
jgi:hypothetical protein